MLKTSAGNGPKLPTPDILQMAEGVVEDVTEADEHLMRDACDTSVSPCSTNESAHRYMSIMIASYFTSPTYTTGFIRSERALHIWDSESNRTQLCVRGHSDEDCESEVWESAN